MPKSNCKSEVKKRSKSPVASRKGCKQSGGGSLVSDEGDNTVSVNTSTILVVLALAVLGIIVYLAYTRSMDETVTTVVKTNNQLLQQLQTTNKNNNNTPRSANRDNMEDVEPLPVPPGMRMVGPDADNVNTASFWGYLNAKSHERIINPLLPPERSYENTYGIPVNIPSRGFSGGYQQVGYLYKKDVADPAGIVGQDPNSVIIPLYGRPLWPGANKWNYYLNSDKFQAIKMPFSVKGRQSDDDHGVDELHDGDSIDVPAYNGKFEVTIYNYDKPRYIPYVY